jgi:hypothetical protein
MDQQDLISQLLDADTPDERATAIHEARTWLAEHPHDARIASALEDLIEFERQLG